MKKKGVFISLEGIDGSGKTTLLKALQERFSDEKPVCIREPGGTFISEKIRKILLDAKNYRMIARTEALLYAAARSQVVSEVIKPALEAGRMVLADRYIDSTVAYQGAGRNLEMQQIKELNRFCTGGVIPDLTIILDLDVIKAKTRKAGQSPDRLESEGDAFQEKVRQGYLRIAEAEPQRVKIINAAQPFEAVVSQAYDLINCLNL
jgi:dTMP kinase